MQLTDLKIKLDPTVRFSKNTYIGKDIHSLSVKGWQSIYLENGNLQPWYRRNQGPLRKESLTKEFKNGVKWRLENTFITAYKKNL